MVRSLLIITLAICQLLIVSGNWLSPGRYQDHLLEKRFALGPSKGHTNLPNRKCSKQELDKEIAESTKYEANPKDPLSLATEKKKFIDNGVDKEFSFDDFPLWAYTDSFFEQINPILRDYMVGKGANRYPCYIDNMMRRVEKLKKPTTCIRLMQHKLFDSLKQGDIVHSNQFESCSTSKHTVGYFCEDAYAGDTCSIYYITTDRVINAKKIKSIGGKAEDEGENELIVPPGHNFKVVEYVKNYKDVGAFDLEKGVRVEKIVLQAI